MLFADDLFVTVEVFDNFFGKFLQVRGYATIEKNHSSCFDRDWHCRLTGSDANHLVSVFIVFNDWIVFVHCLFKKSGIMCFAMICAFK